MIGLVGMAFMVTYMLAAPIFGLLRVNRWWVIAAGVAVWSLACGASGLASSFEVLLVTRCLVGIGEAAYGPVAPTIISDLFPIERRGRVLSWFYMAIPVGSALGYVLGGLVDSWLGWRWAFFSVVVPGLILALIAMVMKEPQSGQSDVLDDDKIKTHKPSFRDYAIFLRSPSYVINTIGQTLMTFAIGGIAFWMPSYIYETRGYGTLASVNLTFGIILVLSGITGTLAGGIAGDKLKPRFSGSYFLVSGAAMILAFPFLLYALVIPFPYAWICIFAACFCLFFNTGPTNTILANVTHPAIRASAFAFNILIIHAFGDVLSPLLIGALADSHANDMGFAFKMVSYLVLLGGIVWLAGVPFLARDEQGAARQLDR
jgi:MFS family permease